MKLSNWMQKQGNNENNKGLFVSIAVMTCHFLDKISAKLHAEGHMYFGNDRAIQIPFNPRLANLTRFQLSFRIF